MPEKPKYKSYGKHHDHLHRLTDPVRHTPIAGQAKKMEDGRLQCIVCPMLVGAESQLSTVDDVFNAIMVRGDATGDVMFYGKGAGKLPTASAVVADIIDCIKHIKARKYLYWDEGSPDYVADYLDNETALYVRAKAAQSAEAVATVREVFGPVRFLSSDHAPQQEIAFITPTGVERDLRAKIKQLSTILEPVNIFRVCEE